MNILIVESDAKTRTLRKYLGDGWTVLATGGHVWQLPDDREKHGRDAGKAYWSNRPGRLPEPPWVFDERGEAAIERIRSAAGESTGESTGESAGESAGGAAGAAAGEDVVFWLATDPDREGEFIAWSLDEILGERGRTRRVAFDEITEEAVRAALDNPRGIDRAMVDSALVRKFLDRLVGYRGSKMANSVLAGRGHSMGRVQTPTLGFVVERELEREAHVPIPYFEVHAEAAGISLAVRFHEPEDDDVWRDDAGKPHPSRTFHGDRAEEARAALEAAGRVVVTSAESRSRRRSANSPFSTDALLQEAGSRFGWSPRKTSKLASDLYEAGHITYIRTDSTRLGRSAVESIRAVVADRYGEGHLGTGSGGTATGPIQDAHEAIRPTRADVEEPDLDDADTRRLYRLVRARTLASQMAPAERTVVSVEAACDDLDRPLTGSVSWRTFAGWEAAYGEFLGDVATAPPDVTLDAGAAWALDPATEERENPRLVEDETRPPPRYRAHTLIRAMKDAGIGRPSTYARTVEKLEERGYVETEDGGLAPTEAGRAIWLLVAPLYDEDTGNDPDVTGLFEPEFTALMEEGLDGIERGDAAPARWEEWRDRVRDLHNLALERRRSGAILPGTRSMLERLLANAPDDVDAPGVDALGVDAPDVDDPGVDGPDAGGPDSARLDDLSEADAREWIQRLREQGVEPAPTPKQLAYIEQLLSDLQLSESELHDEAGIARIDDVRTAGQASALIETLQRLHDERRPPSERQRRFVADLVAEAGISEAEAARLVGLESLDDLTGGPNGTASALIDALKARVRAGVVGS